MKKLALALLAGVVIAYCAHRGSSSAPVQAGVLVDGFVVTEGERVVELDYDGDIRAQHPLPVSGDVRVVGSRVGAIAAWKDGNKVRIIRVEDNTEDSSWGNSVKQLCDGAASNDANFAVGWLESDDRVWMVWGPMAAAEVDASFLRGRNWCGVASAGSNVALAWRDRDKLQWQLCVPDKGCKGIPARFDLPKGQPILAFNCIADACLVATPGKLTYLTNRSKVVWTAALPSTRNVSIAGVGSTSFAVGYDGNVVRYDRKGNTRTLWTGRGSPVVAWSKGHLAIAPSADATEVVSLPE